MKAPFDMDTVQIEVTNACRNRCSNCTRFAGFTKPYFMTFDQFKRAVDSMQGYPKMTGIQGGEPLLHPEFAKFCQHIAGRIPREQLGLWTTFPAGFERYREIIAATFGSVFLNDHSRPDIYHHPFLVAAEEVIPDRRQMFVEVNRCPFQEAWSASINPHGAYFCEIAASLSLLLPEYRSAHFAWEVEPGWWYRTPKDFAKQIEEFCPKCGGALKLKRRVSDCKSGVTDISPGNIKRLQKILPKVRFEYETHDLKQAQDCEIQPMASYKDPGYRATIAARYGIFLTLNPLNFNEPHLTARAHNRKPLLEQYREKYGG